MFVVGCGSDLPSGNTPGATLATSPSQLALTDSSLTATLFLTTSPAGGHLQWQLVAKPSWITLESDHGVVDGVTNLKVTANPAPTDDPGVRTGRIDLVSGGGTASIPVSLTLAPNPKLVLSATSITIAENVDTSTITLTNAGRGFASWSVTGLPGWLRADPANGYVQTGQVATVKLIPDRGPLPAGTSTATVSFTVSNSTTKPSLAVSVAVSPAPQAATDISRLVFAPGSGSRTLMLANPGKGPLAWQLAAKDAWLTVVPASGTIAAGDSVALTVTATGSANTGGFTITSNAVNAPSIRVGATMVATPPSLGMQVLNYRVLDAEFNAGSGLLVSVSTSPSQLNVIDTETGDTWSLALQKPAYAVAIRPDGRFAVVAHDAMISVVDLVARQLVKTYVTTSDAFDVVFPNNGYVYVWPRTDQWTSIHGINLTTGAEENGPTIYAGSHAKLHPAGKVAYGIWYLSPADLEKFDVSSGKARSLGDSPYHGDYPMGYDLWFARDGARIFTAAGTVFRSSPTTTADMLYAGKLPSFGQARMIADNPAKNRIYGFVTGTSPYYVSIPETDRSSGIRVYESSTLNALGEIALPKMQSGSTQADVDGYFLFPSADGRRLHMFVKAVSSSGLSKDWAYYVVDTSTLP